MIDPYKILGICADDSEEVITAKYEELRARYSEQRFLDGEEGNEGARKLHELEVAWAEINVDLKKRGQADVQISFEEVDKSVKEGDLDKAQSILDKMTSRDAKWHYFQAMVFYKKEWLSESRAQLALAVNMEPNNTKYRDALSKIDMVMGNASVNAQTIGNQNQGPYQNQNQYNNQNSQQQYQQQYAGNSCSRCCATYCMMESCCTMMRCCM